MREKRRFGGSVRRVATNSGSHIEPGLDNKWPDIDQLRWKAAVVAWDSDTIHVEHADLRWNGIPVKGYYSIQFGASAIGPVSFKEAWSMMSGIGIGYEANNGCRCYPEG